MKLHSSPGPGRLLSFLNTGVAPFLQEQCETLNTGEHTLSHPSSLSEFILRK